MKRYTNEDIKEFELALKEMQATVLREEKLRKGVRDATPNMTSWPALNNNNNPYHAYRFGISLAGSPDNFVEKEGPIGGNFITISYSDGDEKILKAAAKKMGFSSKSIGSSKQSCELPNVYKSSSVAKIKRNRYGI